MHSKLMLHRDIKPDNFLMGTAKKQHLIYVIDFGLSKQYRKPKTGAHIPYRDGKSLIGTIRYASVNTQLGIEQSRRDDMEALGFVFVYLLRGSLPWQGLKIEIREEKYKAIQDLKASTSPETLCKEYPQEFCTYLNYCRKLSFEEKPDYGYLRKLFRDLYVKKGYEYDYVYDWNTIKGQSSNTNDNSIFSTNIEDGREDKKEVKAEAKKLVKAEHKKEEKTHEETKKMPKEVRPLNKKFEPKKYVSSSRLNSSKALDIM
eukprot:TRINITY_DN8627_c0_g1_i5.p1 TRINITY_DN8627_c0_g1~~TRINITY_DN8627_c0_g1_i5.p1  ORF type:complete len:259 (+),score=83.59 TRINITY_DN8627_c0_g1_i5:510-1286(+)